MKILMVNKFLYPNGGSETYMMNLGAYYTSLGHEVQYFGMEDERNIIGNNVKSYVSNIAFHVRGDRIKKLTYPFRIIYSQEARRKIRAVIHDFHPDIAHMHNINFQITPSIIYELRKYKIPVIQTVHDYQMICPNHMLYQVVNGSPCEKCVSGSYYHCVKEKCIHGSRLRSIIAAIEAYYYRYRKTYHLVDRYIAPSEFLANKLSQGGIPPEKIKILHNFVVAATMPEQTKGEKYALYFGRLSQEKGIGMLIEVCKELPDIQFVFAGTGPLESLLAGAENIQYIGFTTGEKLNSLIRNAKFSLLPSVWFENCPLTILESQALGTPVIGSDYGGIPELIENGKSGLVFKGGDYIGLKSAIRELWDNDKLCDTMSEYCRTKPQVTVAEYTERLSEEYYFA